MLKRIVKKKFIRIYDVLSIIIFSASVNVIIWGATFTTHKTNLFYPVVMLSSILLCYSGWCFYWLSAEIKQVFEEAILDDAAVLRIKDNKMLTSKFNRHYVRGILYGIFGVIFTIISARL